MDNTSFSFAWNETLQNGTFDHTGQVEHTVLSQTKTAYILWRVFPPILIILGTVGNILSIIVLCQNSMRRSGVSKYLICLAVSDLLVLYTGLLRQWINYTFLIDIREIHPALCKLNTWMVYFSLDLSAWILVSVTVERTVSVWLPHRVKFLCTRKVFVLNIVLLAVLLMCLNGHFLFGVGDLILNGKVHSCSNLSMKYAEFLDYVFPWLDLCFFCLIPFLCLVIGNIMIITRLVVGMKKMSRFNVTSLEQITERRRQMSSMTTMLLSLNFVYLLCTLPISVYIIGSGYWEADQSPEAVAKRELAYACVNLLMYLNNSTNFITYTVSGKRFRVELWALLRGKRLRGGSSFTLSTSVPHLSRKRTSDSSYISTIT